MIGQAIEILNHVERVVKEKLETIDQVFLLFDSFPFPCWLKSTDGKLLAVNREYKRHYGVIENTDGTFDSEMSSVLLSEYRANDEWVIQLERGRAFVETCPRRNDQNRKSMVIKFPVYTAADELYGVGGVEIPETEKI